MRRTLIACILSLASAFGLNSTNAEKAASPQVGEQFSTGSKGYEIASAETKTDKRDETVSENGFKNDLRVDPKTRDEQDLHKSLMTKVGSLNSGREKVEPEIEKKEKDGESIAEDFKLPLFILGGLLVYFIPTLLGINRNDFRKLFFANLLSGCLVSTVMILSLYTEFLKKWFYAFAALSWIFVMVRVFMKDAPPPPERERRRKHRSRRYRRDEA